MAILGSFSAVRSQVAPSAGFLTAWDYVQDMLREDSPARARLRSLPPGKSERVDLGGGVFAIEQVYATKPRPEGIFESHRKYIDVQVIVEGAESMEVADLARATAKDPYNEERDFLLYHDLADASVVRVRAGDVAVFFPVDVHMPSLRWGSDAGMVRKTVVKVPVGA